MATSSSESSGTSHPTVIPSSIADQPTDEMLTQPRIEFGAVTDPGKLRKNNEDHFAVVRRTRSREILLTSLRAEPNDLPSDHAYVLIVADGLGGGNCGEVASELVLRFGWYLTGQQPRWLMKFDPSQWPEVEKTLKGFAEEMQHLLREHSRRDAATAGMGTTWTAAYVVGWHVIIAHVGDSRAYLHRKGTLQRLTTDHTMAQKLIDMGLPREDTTKFRHILTNAFGCDNDQVAIESGYHALQPGDRLLLCTDGLYDMLADEQLGELLNTVRPAQKTCDELRDRALAAGGRDNVTVVVADFAGAP